jgi:2-oxoglutarate dehydrogenase E2 component (dihydrolipoamide succinyltransferase)
MKQPIVVPRMGESISQAKIASIFIKSGGHVKADEEILELETDKVNQVIYAPTEGVVQWSVSEGDTIAVGQEIGLVDSEAKAAEPKKTAFAPPPVVERKGKESFLKELEVKTPVPVEPKPVPKPVPAVQREVVMGERETRRPLSKIRKVIAERLVQAQHQAAMLTTFNEVDLTQVMVLRERYKELFLKEYDVKLGFMPFFIKASVSALREFPIVNAYIDGEELVYRNYFDLSVAISSEKGLLVPVIRNCDHISFAEIEKSIDKYAKQANDGTIRMEDLSGGGFTITNGGVFGSLFSTPILNPPQTAILGMHKIVKRPVAINDQIVIRPMMYLALTYDHRVLDGREAVSFLVHIKQCLEDPARLLMEV